MADRGWKAYERRCAKDMNTTRIAVTGERHGADFETPLFVFQAKNRRSLPAWLWTWLQGIRACGAQKNKIGVLVLKEPWMQDTEALVVLTWADWVALHGTK